MAATLLGVAATPASAQRPAWDLGTRAAHRWSLDHWTAFDGLPQNSVNDLVQAPDGFIWIATFGGLARFDGHRFEHLDLAAERGLAENRLLSLAHDPEGRLLVGYERRGVGRMGPDGRIRPVAFQEAAATAVWRLAVDGNGAVWAATEEGLARLAPGADAFAWVRRGGPSRTLAPDGDGIWTSRSGGAVLRFALDGSLTDSIPLGEARPSPTTGVAFRYILPRGDGSVLVGSSVGLLEARRNEASMRRRSTEATWALAEVGSGAVWRGGAGTLRDDAGNTVVEGPYGFNVYTHLRDREGGLWFGTRGGGLLRLRPLAFRRHTLPDDVPVREVTAVAALAADDGSVEAWAASSCRGLFRLGQTGVRRVSPPPGVAPGACARELLPLDGGRLVVRYGDAALHLAPGGPLLPRPDDAPIRRMTRGADGGARVLTEAGYYRLHLAETGGGPRVRWERIHAAPAELGRITGPLLEDPGGTLWIPQDGGVLRVGAARVRRLTTADGVPPGEIRALHRASDGALWIGSYGGGVARIADGGVRRLTRADGLPDNFISAIIEPVAAARGGQADDAGAPTARPGTLWFLGNQAIFALPPDDVDAWRSGARDWVAPVKLDAADGFVEPAGPALVQGPGGRIWIGSLDGVLELDIRRRPRNLAPPRPAVTRVRVDDRDLPGPPWRVPPDGRRVEVHVTAPSFHRPDEVRFRHRLEGPEETGWSRPDPTRRAVFTDLTPGEYRFRVEAINEEGVRSEAPASLALAVEPHLWERGWFRLGLALLALAGVYGLVELRSSFERRRTEALRREIAERERLERQRDQVEARLRRAARLEAVGQLTGGVAHDFNNLLTVVLGNLELAADDLRERGDTRVVPVLDRAREAAVRGGRVTSQLLSFARRQHLTTEVVDPLALVENMRHLLEQAVGEAVELHVRTRTPQWCCIADGTRLESAILNLVLNARDAMPDGGSVTIALGHRTEEGPGTAFGGEAIEPGDYVRLTVEDTGVGIPADELEAVFQPFYTTKEVGKGTGLGLSSVYGLVVQCGGFVEVESTPGAGTAVHLFLPREGTRPAVEGGATRAGAGAEGGGDPPAAAGEPDAPVEPRGHGQGILVVEDSDAVRDVTVRMLEELGYEVRAAPSAADALVALAENPDVALVLSDVVMPGGMSGPQLRDRLALERPWLPVVLMSGHVPEAEGARAGDASADDDVALRKPFRRRELAAVVQRHLRAPGGGARRG